MCLLNGVRKDRKRCDLQPSERLPVPRRGDRDRLQDACRERGDEGPAAH
jgi:hypothetical protein